MIRESLNLKIDEEKNLKFKLEERNKSLAEEEDELIKKMKTTTNIHKNCKIYFIIGLAELEKVEKQKSEISEKYKEKIKKSYGIDLSNKNQVIIHEPLNKRLNFNDFSNQNSRKRTGENFDQKIEETPKVWNSINSKNNNSSIKNNLEKSGNESIKSKTQGLSGISVQKYDKVNHISNNNDKNNNNDKVNKLIKEKSKEKKLKDVKLRAKSNARN